MIVVATEDFEVYHEVVAELDRRDLAFTTIEAGGELPPDATVRIESVTEADRPSTPGRDASDRVPVVRAAPEAPRAAVDRALAVLRGTAGRTVVGVDPGRRPGIAVLVDDRVVAAFHVPLESALETVEHELEGAVDPVVRIGDGARLQGSRLVNDLVGVRVELVDETGTTPHLGAGARGMGDVLAAVNIALTPGEPIESREVDPTSGELQEIKDRSRERADDNRAIDEALARRVAAGELSLEEALEAHREASSGTEPEE